MRSIKDIEKDIKDMHALRHIERQRVEHKEKVQQSLTLWTELEQQKKVLQELTAAQVLLQGEIVQLISDVPREFERREEESKLNKRLGTAKTRVEQQREQVNFLVEAWEKTDKEKDILQVRISAWRLYVCRRLLCLL
jgi:hypothetical protein